tara:strand:+ start:1948 stop:2859 length:912 start_codon:yes stop_codon:yes gene_type:complete
MSNIDCDQIILFGLVAMFAVYIYKNVLDNPNQQSFTIGGQDNMNMETMENMEFMNSELLNEMNNISNNNADMINNMSNQMTTNNAAIIEQQNNMASDMANKLSNLENSIKNDMNTMRESVNVNLGSVSGNGNTNSGSNTYIPAEFKAPEPDTGVDSLPKNYEVGTNKSDSCFPQDVLSAEDLLPKEDADAIKQFKEDEAIGDGVLKAVNFLGAGYHIGVNSVGQSLRNANLQLRSEPPNPQSQVSPWLNTTIAPDLQRRPLELTDSCAKLEGSDVTEEVPGSHNNHGSSIDGEDGHGNHAGIE